MNNMMTNIEVAKIMVSGMKCMLSREQIHELADILVCRKFKKGERILDEGEVCRSMLYLEKGLTRQFYFKYDKDLTEHIAYEGGLIQLVALVVAYLVLGLPEKIIWLVLSTVVAIFAGYLRNFAASYFFLFLT